MCVSNIDGFELLIYGDIKSPPPVFPKSRLLEMVSSDFFPMAIAIVTEKVAVQIAVIATLLLGMCYANIKMIL